jgi:hypothetical protein
MKTTCYCVYCPNHPLHKKQNEFDVLTGWSVGDMILKQEHREYGRLVDCLNPISDAFDSGYLDIIPEDHSFPTTAYNDGGSETGFELDDTGYQLKVFAYCGNEKYEAVEGE